MNDEMVERVGRAVRRRKFERTRRLAHYDATVPLTENELDDARAAIAAIPGWQLIESAPKDGAAVLVYAAPRQGLGGFQCTCAYHEDAGWCVDELREVTHWMPLPAPPEEGHDPHLACPSWPGCDEAPLGCRLVTPPDQLDEYGHKD